jgi:hypothetical protein
MLTFAGETIVFPYLIGSAFNVRILLGNLTVPHPKHVDASQSSGIPITIHPGVYPAPDATVAMGEDVFGLEICPGVKN